MNKPSKLNISPSFRLIIHKMEDLGCYIMVAKYTVVCTMVWVRDLGPRLPPIILAFSTK